MKEESSTQRAKRRKCKRHNYKFVGRRYRGNNTYYLFFCIKGDHRALFNIRTWWGVADVRR